MNASIYRTLTILIQKTFTKSRTDACKPAQPIDVSVCEIISRKSSFHYQNHRLCRLELGVPMLRNDEHHHDHNTEKLYTDRRGPNRNPHQYRSPDRRLRR